LGLLDLGERKAELEKLGFTVVRDQADELVGVRLKFHWDLTMRLFTVVRIRRTQRLEMPLGSEQDSLEAIAKTTDYSVTPRGFQFGWQLVDIWLADSASDEALAYVGDKVGKGMGVSWHPAVLTADGTLTHASPFWGAAMWPKTQHVIERLAQKSTVENEPIAGIGLFLTLFIFWPALASVVLMMCGLPLIALPIGWAMEKDRSFPQLD